MSMGWYDWWPWCFPPLLQTLLMCSACTHQSSSSTVATANCNNLLMGPFMILTTFLIRLPLAPLGKIAPSFAIASNKTTRASWQCRRLFSSQIVQISIAANAGFLEIFVIVARFPEHSTIDSTDSQTLFDTLIFEAQWLHRFLLLQFPLHDLARKKNPSWGLLVLPSNTPWYGMQILRDVKRNWIGKALDSKIGLPSPLP